MKILSIDEAKQFSSNKVVVIITGVTGQDGSLMADYLIKNTDYEIFGGARRLSVSNHENISHLEPESRFHLINFDLTDAHSISQIICQLKPSYFINFAAQSFVKSSWDFPAQTWETNTTSIIHILESIRLHCPKCRFYNAGCHSSDTRVLTPRGLKHYTELSIGDLVYSINPKNGDLEFKPILKVFEYDYDGDLFEFKHGGLRVTPNHTMLYKTKRGNILSNKADEFIDLSDVKYPTPNPYKGKMLPETINLEEFIPTPIKLGNKNYSKHITEINAYDLMYLIGLYIGDGSCRIMKRKHRRQCIFSGRERNSMGQFDSNLLALPYEDVEYSCPQCVIDIPPTDECFPEVIKTLERNNIRWKLHGQCDITFHQWGLNPYFSECGHSAPKKRIPLWIFDLDYTYQKQVLKGIMDSDGDKRNTISTSSIGLQEDLLKLFVNCGIMPTFGDRPPRTSILKDGRIIKGNYPEYHIHGLKENTGYQRGNYTKIPYKGKVWCFEIEDNHNFLVERNGQLTFSGNSSEEFGDVEYTPQDEKHPMRPCSPYGASKAAARQLVRVYRESYGLYAIQGWLFNHEGTRRGEEFVTRKITKAVAKIQKQIRLKQPITPFELGNLNAKRDWSDAEDSVRAVWCMLNQDKYNPALNEKMHDEFPELYSNDLKNLEETQWLSKNINEYVVSSGENHTVREFVEEAFTEAGIQGKWCITDNDPMSERYVLRNADGTTDGYGLVTVNPAFYRPAEVNCLLGNNTLIINELGWTPIISFKVLVRKMVEQDIDIENS